MCEQESARLRAEFWGTFTVGIGVDGHSWLDVTRGATSSLRTCGDSSLAEHRLVSVSDLERLRRSEGVLPSVRGRPSQSDWRLAW